MENGTDLFVRNLFTSAIIACSICLLILRLDASRSWSTSNSVLWDIGLAGVVSLGIVTTSSWIARMVRPARRLLFSGRHAALAAATGRVLGVVVGLIVGVVLVASR